MKRAKRFLSILLTLCMVLSMIPGTAFAANSNMPFTDVKEGDWFYDAVEFVYEEGMMNGTGDVMFSPNVPTTRGMIWTILARYAGHATDGAPWYAPGQAWAMESNVSDGTDPMGNITREQMVTMLYRYAGSSAVTGDLSRFLDANQVSDYAKDAMIWAVTTGIITGDDKGYLAPKDNATRAETAAILMRFCKANISNLCTVTFSCNDSNQDVYKIVSVTVGKTVAKPMDPSRSGYSFGGWYTAEKNGEKFDFDTVISEDITLYAKWVKSGSSGTTASKDDGTTDKTTSEEYYSDIADLIDVIPVEDSDALLTETEVQSFLEERGFTTYPITYEASIKGEDVGETEVSDGSTDKHPMYQTSYFSENGELWTIYVINGDIFAYPASFNLESDLGAELLVSESKTITTYYMDANQFCITIPYASAEIVLTVDTIDAAALDGLSIAAICEQTGATPPAVEDEEDDLSVAAYSVEEDLSVATYSGETALMTAGTTSAVEDPLIVVSLGDSYSSGEGIPPFLGQKTNGAYGQEKEIQEKVKDEDWLAHRSMLAWPVQLEVPGVDGIMGTYLVGANGIGSSSAPVQWYFAAASGAETKHLKGKQDKPYHKKMGLFTIIESEENNPPQLPAQLEIFNTYDLTGKVDYVTLTIGGNDVGFEGIIKTCVVESSYIMDARNQQSQLEKDLDDIWNNFYTKDGYESKIKQAYLDIIEKAGAQAAIIVAGYPTLFDKNGKGPFDSKDEATLINQNVTRFNDALREIVCSLYLQEKNIYFVDVASVFDGHEAYTEDAWINKIELRTQSEDLVDGKIGSSYSIHPNFTGATKYAECVNAMIKDLERTMSGVVTIDDGDNDATNNVPLEDVCVTITSKEGVFFKERQTTSDSSGAYSFEKKLFRGTYNVTFSKEGYTTATKTITITENSASAMTFDIAMKPKNIVPQKLPTPTELTWGRDYGDSLNTTGEYTEVPGMISWKTGPGQKGALVTIYRVNDQGVSEESNQCEWDFSGEEINETGYRSVFDFIDSWSEQSGTYYFTVQSIDEEGTCYGEVATSGRWTYVKPEAQLPQVQNAAWVEVDGAKYPSITWYKLTDCASSIYAYRVDAYFSQTEDGEKEWVCSTYWDWDLLMEDEELWEHGAGYYCFKVCALSNDITTIRNGSFSEMSPVYHYTG